jgi:hypothetical protein
MLITNYASVTWKSKLKYVKRLNRIFSWKSCEKTAEYYGRNLQMSEVVTGDKYILTSLM